MQPHQFETPSQTLKSPFQSNESEWRSNVLTLHKHAETFIPTLTSQRLVLASIAVKV